MLKMLFQWLDNHPASYWFLAGAATLLVTLRVWFIVRQEVGNFTKAKSGGAGDALLLWLFLLAWRWPFLLAAYEFNPDESQLIAGAMTLSHDPVFWRSVDGTTSGPLNFYPLSVYAWLGLPLDYFTARLTGLFLIFGALLAVHRALTDRFSRSVAWLSIMPAAGFFATATHWDLIHYSSEQVSLFLTGVSIWLLAAKNPAGKTRRRWACFIAGAAVWAKLQGAPLSVALFIWALWAEFDELGAPRKFRWRQALELAACFIGSTLVIAAVVVATGQTESAVRRYVLQNLVYVGNARPFGEAIFEMTSLARADGRLPILLATVLSLALALLGYFIFVRRIPGLFITGALLTLAAIVAVVAPRREFLHYTLLLPIPLAFWLGAAVGGCWTTLISRRGQWIVAGLLFVAGGMTPVITRCFQPPPEIYGRFAYNWSHPRTSTAMVVHALATKGSVGIWGWANDIYVESGLSQATRDAHSVWSIQENHQRDYHRVYYLEDLKRNAPVVFVDAVGPGAFCYEDRKLQAHEIFPELTEYLQQNYTLVTDLVNARIYARRELPELSRMDTSRVLDLRSQGRLDKMQGRIAAPLGSLASFQRKSIGGREVVMLLPPAQMEWALEPDMREVSLELGFDPVAYERGRSNGAEIFLELADGRGTQVLFHRFIDPAQNVEDRLPCKVTVPLESFGSGAHLVLRTGPGPYGDTAWDWVYLASVQFKSARMTQR